MEPFVTLICVTSITYKMSSAVGGDDIYNQQQYPAASSTGLEPDSDAEDDPGKLLNAWLGQLNKDISTGENI